MREAGEGPGGSEEGFGRRAALLHGFTGSAEAWGAAVLEGLVREGVDALAIDLPGHGSDAGTDDPADFSLETTLGRIDSEAGRVGSVVGYSMGGRLALHHALRSGSAVRRLVLESASPGLEDDEARAERRAADEALADRIVRIGIERFVDEWEGLPLFASQARLPADVRARHRARRLRNDPRSLAAALRGLGTGALPSLWDRLAELSVPTLLVVGELDGKFVEIGRRMEAALPQATLAVVPGAGHTVHLERPDAWLALVTGFLRG